jgi:hypothetical protein
MKHSMGDGILKVCGTRLSPHPRTHILEMPPTLGLCPILSIHRSWVGSRERPVSQKVPLVFHQTLLIYLRCRPNMLGTFLTRFTAFSTCSWKNMARKQLCNYVNFTRVFFFFLFEIISPAKSYSLQGTCLVKLKGPSPIQIKTFHT